MIYSASRCEIRFSSSINQLRHNFENSTLVEEHHVINGTLTDAQPSLAEENIQLHLPNAQQNTTYYIGLRVWDDADRNSQTSNIVTVVFSPWFLAQAASETTTLEAEDVPTTPAEPTETTAQTVTTEGHSTLVIVGAVVGCVLATAVIVAVTVFLVYSYTKSSKGRATSNTYASPYQYCNRALTMPTKTYDRRDGPAHTAAAMYTGLYGQPYTVNPSEPSYADYGYVDIGSEYYGSPRYLASPQTGYGARTPYIRRM